MMSMKMVTTRAGTFLIMLTTVFSMTCPKAFSDEGAKVVKISAKRYEFSPQEISLKKGVPVILQLMTEDRSHGFSAPSMNLQAEILPGKITELKVTPQKAGTFDFFCDVFCGSGHEGMNGRITVAE
jgi:cytochrome c oxidase subunit II